MNSREHKWQRAAQKSRWVGLLFFVFVSAIAVCSGHVTTYGWAATLPPMLVFAVLAVICAAKWFDVEDELVHVERLMHLEEEKERREKA